MAAVFALCVYAAEFWYWTSLGFPTPSEIGEAAKGTANKNEALHYAFSFHLDLWIVCEWLGTHLLEIGTIALASFVFIQIRDTRKSSERQLRAYISVEPGQSFTQNKRRKTVFEFRPFVVNNGQTPANDVRISSMIEMVAPSRPETFNYVIEPVTGPFSVTTIGPRQNRFHTRLFNRRFTISEMKRLLRGTKSIHIWGVVDYLDIFKRVQRTKFSFLVYLTTKRSQVVWNNTELFNDAT
jgi:hypothetical protein